MIADNGDFCRQTFWPFCHMTQPWALSSFHRHWVITANWLEPLFIVGFSDFQRLFALAPVFRSDLLSRVRPQRNTALVLCCGCVVVVLTYVPVSIFISFCLLLWVCKQANDPDVKRKKAAIWPQTCGAKRILISGLIQKISAWSPAHQEYDTERFP